MRTLVVSLLLAGAALAALPSASAAAAPPLPSVICNPDFAGVCIRADDDGTCAGVNVGLQGAFACVGVDGVRVCTSMHTALYGNCPTDLLSSSAAAAGPSLDLEGLVWCNPDFAGACASTGHGSACAGVNFGLQGAGACVSASEGVRACTSMRSILWDGFCPTDGTVLDELVVLP